MADMQTLKDVKIPYPDEGMIRTAQIDDTISPTDSAQLAANMNFDRVGAVQTRLGVTQYATQLGGAIENFGTLNNFTIPAGFNNMVSVAPNTEFTASAGYLSAALVDATHAIVFWEGPESVSMDGYNPGLAQVVEFNTDDGTIYPIGTALPFGVLSMSSEIETVTQNTCIQVDATHFLNIWSGYNDEGNAQVFAIDGSYNVTAIGTPYQFDAAGAYFTVSQVDASHFVVFYTGTGVATTMQGISTVLAVNLSTYAITEPGSHFSFEIGSTVYSSCASLGDGIHYINFWDSVDSYALVQALVVGAQGGIVKNGFSGGGGGGGAYYYSPTFPISINSYSVTVGTGGVVALSGTVGNSGGSSSFSSVTSPGGAGGGAGGSNNGSAGGNATGGASAGGGGSGTISPGAGGTATGGGHNGGTSSTGGYGSGGGGAGEVGGNGSGGGPGAGGNGISNSISGSSVSYGNGMPGGNLSVWNNGINGVVIISYPTGSVIATGGTITTSGGNTIHTFTTNGTFDVTAITASPNGGKTQVFDVNTSTWAITALSTPHVFDSTAGLYNSAVAVGDGIHFINFWNGVKSGTAGGYAQVFAVNASTFAVTEPSTYTQFNIGSGTYNSAVSMQDGLHFVNFWVGSANEGQAELFEIDAVTYAVYTINSTVDLGAANANMSNSAVFISPSRVINFWSQSSANGAAQVFALQGSPVRHNYLYAQIGTNIESWDGSTWAVVRSNLNPAGGKARFTQYLNLVWMVNGSQGDPVQTSNGGDFSDSFVPQGFPSGDFIHAGFEGRVWIADALYGVIYYTDIVQFTPPSTYVLTYTPAVNFISQIAPQNGETITGLYKVPKALLVFTQNTITRIYGATSLDAYPAYNVGTYSQESIVKTKTGILFHHSSGIYQFDYGGQPVEISRRVIDFIQAIPRSNYENVTGIWDGFDCVEWAIGAVTVEGITFTNCVLRYTLSTQVWTVYDYVGNYITAMISYDDGTNLNMIMGTNAGKVGAMNTGFTDFGQPFYYDYIDRWRSFTDMYAAVKTISGVNIYNENAAGTNFSYQTQDDLVNEWSHLLTISEDNSALFPNIDSDDFNVIRFRLAGTTRGNQVVIHGIEILSITNKGYDEN